MQAAESGLRYGSGTQVDINYSVPRSADVRWTAANGYTRNRLPIQWEMLQPMLFDTNANAAARAAIGEPGAFNAAYESFITNVLDAHAAAGIKCMLDLHNYCRYRDFVFQQDGSVIGLVKPANPLTYAYSSDANQVRTRIFATATGATLTPAHFVDFWTRVVRKWKDHPGFGGYGLMNEPYNLPAPGTTVESSAGDEDLHIWPTFAKAAVDAIRALDPTGIIYLNSNQWSAAFLINKSNPDWPLPATNLVYEVHMYLDAASSGQRYDYDYEVSRGFSAGFGSVPLNLDTGWKRLEIAVNWARQYNIKLALTDYARANNVDIITWNGGNHWPLHNYGINNVPGWHQNKTLEPAMSGVVKKSAGVARATVFDDGPGYSTGAPLTITVYARGYLATPATLSVASSNGGSFSSSTITLPAGANPQATYTFTPAADRVTTLTYTVVSGGTNAPPPRKVYSLADPAAYAGTSLPDAAGAILAKYSACKWEAADGYTDYELGAPSSDSQQLRAISDSGYGSSVGNAMEMINWMNTDLPRLTDFPPPVMRVVNGKKAADMSAPGSSGLWCKKVVPTPMVQPNPRNVVPYTLADAHFMIAAVSVPTGANSGIVFQASHSAHMYASQLSFANSRPQAICLDETGKTVTLTAPGAVPAGQPAVLSFTNAPGAQSLRVNRQPVASGNATFAASVPDQLMIGWGFQEYYPRAGFGGSVFAVITGKGAPSAAELQVLEQYLASTAG